MKASIWLKTGVIGSIVAAPCCFTPLLVISLTSLGLAAWIGYLDMLLLPALILFMLITIVAWLQKGKGSSS